MVGEQSVSEHQPKNTTVPSLETDPNVVRAVMDSLAFWNAAKAAWSALQHHDTTQGTVTRGPESHVEALTCAQPEGGGGSLA